MTKQHCCNHNEVQVQAIKTDDDRRAERHFSVNDEGHEVVEIFAEERRPLKLEKRIIKEKEEIVGKVTEETIKDGEVVHKVVKDRDPLLPLQMVENLGMADHAKLVDGDYVRKEEIGQMVSDAVVAGMSAMMDNYEPVQSVEEHHHHHHHEDENKETEPLFNAQNLTAQSEIEGRVANKKGNDMTMNIIMGGIIVVQVIFFAYMMIFVL
jgi:hypothetical protein